MTTTRGREALLVGSGFLLGLGLWQLMTSRAGKGERDKTETEASSLTVVTRRSSNPLPHQAPTGSHTAADNPVLLNVASGTTEDKIVIVMVGLPARGKSYIGQKIARYLTFFHGVPVRIFNVGNYRRKVAGNFKSAAFFDPNNPEAEKQRMECRELAMQDLQDYMEESNSGQIAVLDATHSTKVRRQTIVETLRPLRVKVIFIESYCTNEAMIEKNIRSVKIGTPDYKGMDPNLAVKDFRERIRQYEKVYQTLDFAGDEKHLSGIKIIDSSQYIINRVRGYLPGRIAQFVMSLHTSKRAIYLSRHGQSEYNKLGKIGGDSGLTTDGDLYAKKLAEFADTRICRDPDTGGVVPARLWTSTLRRCIETSRYIPQQELNIGGEDYKPWCEDDVEGRTQQWFQCRPKYMPALDEIYAGICDGMSYSEIEQRYPEEFERRKKDKLAYRYPRGESYLDVIHRLDQVVHEMERHREPLLIIGHQGILRLLYAFFRDLPREKAPHVSIPLNTVIKLHPRAYGCDEERFELHDMLQSSDGQDEPQPAVADPPSH